MSYVDRPGTDRSGYGGAESVGVNQVVDYHDRVRWGPIFSGLVIAISLQLVLSALGAAVGASLFSGSGSGGDAGDAARGVGIWAIISLLISLFAGGMTAGRACGPMNRSTALLNGAVLWGTTLALGSWLLASGVSGAFGVLASSASDVAGQVLQPGGVDVPTSVPSPDVSAGQVKDAAGGLAKANWWFALGSLLGLIASIVGATAGARSPRARA